MRPARRGRLDVALGPLLLLPPGAYAEVELFRDTTTAAFSAIEEPFSLSSESCANSSWKEEKRCDWRKAANRRSSASACLLELGRTSCGGDSVGSPPWGQRSPKLRSWGSSIR